MVSTWGHSCHSQPNSVCCITTLLQIPSHCYCGNNCIHDRPCGYCFAGKFRVRCLVFGCWSNRIGQLQDNILLSIYTPSASQPAKDLSSPLVGCNPLWFISGCGTFCKLFVSELRQNRHWPPAWNRSIGNLFCCFPNHGSAIFCSQSNFYSSFIACIFSN